MDRKRVERHRDYLSYTRSGSPDGRRAPRTRTRTDTTTAYGGKNQCSHHGRDGGRVAVMTIVAPSNGTPPPEKGYFSDLDDGVLRRCSIIQYVQRRSIAENRNTVDQQVQRKRMKLQRLGLNLRFLYSRRRRLHTHRHERTIA